MPIFNNEFTFIHIPKTGGSTIESFLVNNGYQMSLYEDSRKLLINKHSPQHCTFRELESLNLLTDKIFTIVRPEIDRVVSEYFYIMELLPELRKLFNNFDEFLDIFLNKNNSYLFDNHNLSNNEFIINKEGIIDPKIKIFNFFDIEEIEEYLGLRGLHNFHEMKTKKYDVLKSHHINRINSFYGK